MVENYFSYIGKKLLFRQLQTIISYNRIFLRQTLIIDLWVCEVSAKLTQYIDDKQRVLKMLYTWQRLLTCNCNCSFFYTKHTLLYSLNHIYISAWSLQ